MKRLAAALLVLTLGACGVHADAPPRPAPTPIRISAQAVPLDAAHPTAQQVGHFAYAGGLWLKSPDTTLLGGQSDLKVSVSGDLVSETDEGSLLRAHVVLDSRGRLAGLDQATIQKLTGLDGEALKGKRQSDAEGVMLWPNGDLSVSFERNHRIWTYPASGDTPRPLPIPKVAMPSNEGMEGLALAPSQGSDAYWVGVEAGSIWLCHAASGCRQWPGLMSPPPGYRLTALYETPGGDLIVLHHNYDPLSRVSRVLVSILALPGNPRAIAQIKDQLLLQPPMTVDNFEGVAALPRPGGGLRLYLISDDNFSDRQRTLLLAFDWSPAGGKKPEGGN